MTSGEAIRVLFVGYHYAMQMMEEKLKELMGSAFNQFHMEVAKRAFSAEAEEVVMKDKGIRDFVIANIDDTNLSGWKLMLPVIEADGERMTQS